MEVSCSQVGPDVPSYGGGLVRSEGTGGWHIYEFDGAVLLACVKPQTLNPTLRLADGGFC